MNEQAILESINQTAPAGIMDDFTRKHLAHWIADTMYEEDVEQMIGKAIEAFSDDAEYASNLSWWEIRDR